MLQIRYWIVAVACCAASGLSDSDLKGQQCQDWQPCAVQATGSFSAVSTPVVSASDAVIPAASPASFYTLESSTPPATTPAAVMTSSSTTSAAAAPTSTAALAKSAGISAPTSASDSASCQGEGAACQGDITYYPGGLGACGVNVDPSGNGIALPFEFMGTASNSNPYCGKTLTIYNPATGKSAQATVMDKCMGCTGRSIDLMLGTMNELTNNEAETLGRVSGVDWWFN